MGSALHKYSNDISLANFQAGFTCQGALHVLAPRSTACEVRQAGPTLPPELSSARKMCATNHPGWVYRTLESWLMQAIASHFNQQGAFCS